MKTTFRLLTACMVTVLALVSCNKESESVLRRNTDVLNFPDTKSSQFFYLESSGDWQASASADWILVSPSSGSGSSQENKIEVAVKENYGKARTGYVYLSNKAKEISITINQEDGFFYYDTPVVPSSFVLNSPISGSDIMVPYFKAKLGQKVSTSVELSGDGCDGIVVENLKDYELEAGDGKFPIRISGTPSRKGAVLIKLTLSKPEGDPDVYNLESRVKLDGEVVAKIHKLLPRLVVFDWGEYEKGSGTNGAGTEPRHFFVQLCDKSGNVLRTQDMPTSKWFIDKQIYFRKNRFAIGALTPNTDYVFKIVAKELGSEHDTDSDVYEVPFTTPAETVTEGENGVLLYKDFDNFWLCGCPIYQAFGPSINNSNVGAYYRYDLSPNVSSINFGKTWADGSQMARTDMVIWNPDFAAIQLLGYAGNASMGYVTSDACPNVWEWCWEGSKYGATTANRFDTYDASLINAYSEAHNPNYYGWKGGVVRHSLGSVLVGDFSSASFLQTPKLRTIGAGTADIRITFHTAAYVEPCKREAGFPFIFEVIGPGTIVDGGASLWRKDSDTKILLTNRTSVDASTLDYNLDNLNVVENVVVVEGATSETSIKLSNSAAGCEFHLDDIRIDKIK